MDRISTSAGALGASTAAQLANELLTPDFAPKGTHASPTTTRGAEGAQRAATPPAPRPIARPAYVVPREAMPVKAAPKSGDGGGVFGFLKKVANGIAKVATIGAAVVSAAKGVKTGASIGKTLIPLAKRLFAALASGGGTSTLGKAVNSVLSLAKSAAPLLNPVVAVGAELTKKAVELVGKGLSKLANGDEGVQGPGGGSTQSQLSTGSSATAPKATAASGTGSTGSSAATPSNSANSSASSSSAAPAKSVTGPTGTTSSAGPAAPGGAVNLDGDPFAVANSLTGSQLYQMALEGRLPQKLLQNPEAMLIIQTKLQEFNRQLGMLSQLSQVAHDSAKQVINNLRV